MPELDVLAAKSCPVLPNIRPLEDHVRELVLKTLRMENPELKKFLALSSTKEADLIQEAMRALGNLSQEALVAVFDNLVNTSSRILNVGDKETVYVLPSDKHDGRGFVRLQLADELQYFDAESGTWRSCELTKDSFVYDGSVKQIEVLDFERAEFTKVDPWFIRRPVKG